MKRTQEIFYLASPYTHSDDTVKKARAQAVTKAAVDLLKLGIFTFAPIAYNEPWERHELPGDWEFWCNFDKAFVERCDGGLIVLTLDGWDKSVGVTAEIEFAKELGHSVYYVSPKEIENKDLSFLNRPVKREAPIFCSYAKF